MERSPELESWASWGAGRAQARISAALEKRFAPQATRRWIITTGLLGRHLDMTNSRLIVLVDPEMVDVEDLRRWVDRVAAEANTAARVRGAPVTVTVQPGCFPTAQALEVLKRAPQYGAQRMRTQVELDGRLHISFYPRQRPSAQLLRHRYGPIVAVDPCNLCSDRPL